MITTFRQCMFALSLASDSMAVIANAASADFRNYAISYTDLGPPSSLSGTLFFTSGNQQGGAANGQAAVWNGPFHTMVNYNPPGWTYSYIEAGAGNQLVGGVYKNGYYAALWTGAPSSFVNLHPAEALSSVATDTDGFRQSGYLQRPAPSYQVRAGFWSGTASSFVDLHPDETAISSVAYAISGNQEGGSVNYNGFGRAALWSGTAASFTDLGSGAVLSVTSTQQAGVRGQHAGVWFGTAASFVDLNPVGAAWSEAHATIDTMQTGFAAYGPYRHALLWFGSASDYIDLQPTLRSTYRESQAESVWTDGNRVFVAGSAVDFRGASHPILWTLIVPEPPVVALCGLGLAAFVAIKLWAS